MANTEYGPGVVPAMPNSYLPGGAFYQNASDQNGAGLAGSPSLGSSVSAVGNVAKSAAGATP